MTHYGFVFDLFPLCPSFDPCYTFGAAFIGSVNSKCYKFVFFPWNSEQRELISPASFNKRFLPVKS